MFLFLLSLHLLGAFLTVAATVGAVFAPRSEAASNVQPTTHGSAKWAMFHGIGLSLLLLSGFALILIVYQGEGFASVWFWSKVAIWLVLGASLAVIRRRPALARTWWVLVPCLATLAGVLGQYKPCCF